MVPLADEPPELLELLASTAVTWMEKAGSAVLLSPSLAEMTILAYRPARASGVPASSPLVTAKVAQAGLFAMLKFRGALVGLVTVGRNT